MGDHHCRVCGLYIEDLPWGEDNNTPTFDICSCCGMEFGHEDYTIELVRSYRKQWLDRGTPWFNRRAKPADWGLDAQMKNISKDWL